MCFRTPCARPGEGRRWALALLVGLLELGVVGVLLAFLFINREPVHAVVGLGRAAGVSAGLAASVARRHAPAVRFARPVDPGSRRAPARDRGGT